MRIALEVVFEALLNLFEADHAAVAIQHLPDEKAYLWEAQVREGERKTGVRLSELESFQRARYFFQVPAQGWFALPGRGPRMDGRFRTLLVGSFCRCSCRLRSARTLRLHWPSAEKFLAAISSLSAWFRKTWPLRIFLPVRQPRESKTPTRLGHHGREVRLRQ